MKTLSPAKLLLIFAALFAVMGFFSQNETADIPVHDTYFVFDRMSVNNLSAILMLLFALLHWLFHWLGRPLHKLLAYLQACFIGVGLFLTLPLLMLLKILTADGAPDTVALGGVLPTLIFSCLGLLLFVAGLVLFVVAMVKALLVKK